MGDAGIELMTIAAWRPFKTRRRVADLVRESLTNRPKLRGFLPTRKPRRFPCNVGGKDSDETAAGGHCSGTPPRACPQ